MVSAAFKEFSAGLIGKTVIIKFTERAAPAVRGVVTKMQALEEPAFWIVLEQKKKRKTTGIAIHSATIRTIQEV